MLYNRIMLKLSGEALGGNGQTFDRAMVINTAKTLAKVAATGCEVAVVIGAGNIWRGREGADMDEVTAHTMGMLGTVINCLCIKDALIHEGVPAQVLSAISMPKVCDEFNAQKARDILRSKQVLFLGGGSGNPFFSTDTAVVLRALELNSDVILLAKNVDGVYDSDPRQNPNAKFLKKLTYDEAQDMRLKVMDNAAFALCAENRFPMIRVFGLEQPDNILRVLQGEDIGSTLTP